MEFSKLKCFLSVKSTVTVEVKFYYHNVVLWSVIPSWYSGLIHTTLNSAKYFHIQKIKTV